MTESPAVQDRYPEQFAHCYGCGRLNAHGLHVQTRWEGDVAVARFTPRPEHVAVPGFVYGGLIASLVDCHGIGTAALATERAAGHEAGGGSSGLRGRPVHRPRRGARGETARKHGPRES